MPPDEPIDEARQQLLPEDGQTPFQPADPNPSITGNTTDPVVQAGAATDLPDDHPATDTAIDPTELYDEGMSGAAEVEDTSNQTAVTDFTADGDDQPEDVAL